MTSARKPTVTHLLKSPIYRESNLLFLTLTLGSIPIEVKNANMADSVTQHPVLRIQGLRHELRDKEKNERFNIYAEPLLEFCSGDFIGLLGPSGCGKTTLLTVLGLLRQPTHTDEIELFDLHIPSNEKEQAWQRIDLKQAWLGDRKHSVETLRREYFGFALQSGELISSLTVRENICVPLRLNLWSHKQSRERANQLIDQFGLTRIRDTENKIKRDPSQAADVVAEIENSTPSHSAAGTALANSRINRLSGGEYQRVALARAIAHKPSVVFVDEPTSALNRELARNALTALRDLQLSRGMPGITFMITHDETLAEEFCNAIVRMAPRKNEPAGEVSEFIRK